MAAIQLNFTLRTSANCKTVHLLGSWDNYAGQLPLSKDPSKVGGWKGAFRFQGQTLRQGQRYWYYYIMDGYHVSHDPAREAVIEPTTGRKLNVLDIPASKTTVPPTSLPTARDHRAKRQSRGLKVDSSLARGRPLSQSEIRSPRPQKPQETQKIRNEQFHNATLELLTASLAASHIVDDDESDESEDDDSDIDSDISSNVPSLTSRTSNSSSPSSVSSVSSHCSCERYGITRAGGRVKLDCGGSRCGYSDGSDCNSESENECNHKSRVNTRRHGMYLRQ